MRRIAIFLVAIPLVLAACGGATPAATQRTATQVPTEQPAATDFAVTEPPAASGTGTEVDITLADNTIDSSLTTFQVGVPYTFVITNTGQHAHNFNINKPVSVAGSLETALNGALLAVPQDQLSPGASVTVEFTFPETSAGQLLEFSCLIRKHYEDGMLLGITVTN